ncbi:MAG: CBS domain-containing protein [Magnetococcales bacterium]|nr:CBS domain-containing protein [Magnetococcales bacterium]
MMVETHHNPNQGGALYMKQEFTGIHHTAFATNDIEKTVRFWRDLIGARLTYSYGKPGYQQYFFQISGTNKISFFAWNQVKPVAMRRHGEPVEGPFIFDHIAIGVANKNMLWDMMARLDAAGFPCSDVIDHGCFLSIYSYDPNGIPIEFSTDVPGLDLYWNPVIEDKAVDSDFLTHPNPIPGQWPLPEIISEEEKIIVPGEGIENFADRIQQKDNVNESDDHLKVGDVMTRNVHTAKTSDKIMDIANTLCLKKISGMPVVDDENRLVGIISEKDILEAIYPGVSKLRENPEMVNDFSAIEDSYSEILHLTVENLMIKSVFSVKSDDPAIKAAVQMDIHNIQRLPVIDISNTLLGFVSRGDIHKAIFKRHLTR